MELRPDNAVQGAIVSLVNEKSPAQRAGLRAGDIIKAFDGKPVQSYTDLLRLLSTTQVHDKEPLQIIRDGETQAVIVEIGERPEEEAR
jgi:serine protease Do